MEASIGPYIIAAAAQKKRQNAIGTGAFEASAAPWSAEYAAQ
jgi:hypothetical protein